MTLNEAFDEVIEELKPKWVPVSEKLPNLDDYTGSRVWQKKVLITGYLSFDDAKNLFVSEAFAKDVICNSVHDTVVVAWMPLPEPYKEENEVQKMTREEAIAYGKRVIDLGLNDETQAFCEMAIEALEQEPCEDAISRQAVLDALENIGSLDTEADKEYAKSVFEELPPVTPQPKMGRWIKEKSICGWDGYSYQCSVCGRSIHLDIEVEDLEDYPYCHCGAKMENEVEEFDNLDKMLEKLWNEVEE